MSKTCAFTIVANNYRHFARTLLAGVRRHDPGIDLFVAICDAPLAGHDPRDVYTEISIRDLGLPKFDRFTFQYTILELNTAIKPWVIAHLFEQGYERVIYFDPDINVYGSVAPILERLEHAQIVLTPHLIDPMADDGRHPSELAILQSGSYNLGFVALRRTATTRQFVTWWQSKLLRDCIVDIPRGLFTDQKWIDLVPGMFAGVYVERDPGWNVAYWNLGQRPVTRHADATVVSGRPLLFFHYSGFTPGKRQFSKHQDRLTMESVGPEVRRLADAYAEDLKSAGFDECRDHRYAFGFFIDGEPIPDRVRACFREDFRWDDALPDLWTEPGQAALCEWLGSPAPGHRGTPWLTRIAMAVHRQRADLQREFPDAEGTQSRSYATWFVEHAAEQERIPEKLIASVRSALNARRTTTGASAGASEAGAPGSGGTVRAVYRLAYRTAWFARRTIKPLTTQAFRHRVRHALMRKAYFDASYATPPLRNAKDEAASAGAPIERATVYPAHVAGEAMRPEAARPGVNLIGYLTAESGVGESARSMLRILRAAGVPVNAIEFRVGNVSRMLEEVPLVAPGTELYPINLFQVNADQMFVARDYLGSSLFEGRYNIGCWAWELAEFPEQFVSALDLVDEVWALSSFSQQAIAAKAMIPVLRVPCSVESPQAAPDRKRFGLRDGEVAFFAMCDVLSVPERKNPLGVIAAFRAAFPAGEGVRLLLKVGNLEFQPDLDARLREAQRDDPRIVLLAGYLARDELWSLMASIDCFVSLHRAEGFGLGMAEAMACGKPVIATGWSGNSDFTRSDNALLIDYRLVALERDYGPYRRGQRWAEPDVDSAAAAMRRLADSAELRQRLGRRGLSTVAGELSPAALAPAVRSRLDVIDRLQRRGIRGTG